MLKRRVIRLLNVVLVCCCLSLSLTVYGASQITCGDAVPIETGGQIYSMVKLGDYLYAGGANGLEIFDLSQTPAAKVELAEEHVLRTPCVNSKGSVYTDGTFLYVSTEDASTGLRVRKVYRCGLDDPENPTAEEITIPYAKNPAVTDMAVKDGWLFVSASNTRMFAALGTKGRQFFQSNVQTFDISGNTLYVALNGQSPANTGVFAFDISNPDTLSVGNTLENWANFNNGSAEIGELCQGYRLFTESAPSWNQVEAMGNYLYVSETTNKRIYRIDISDPANLASEEKWELFYEGESNQALRAFDLDGQYLYLYQGSNLKVLDLATGEVLVTEAVSGDCNQVLVADGAVYVAAKSNLIQQVPVQSAAVTIDPYGVSSRGLAAAGQISDTDSSLRIYGMAAYGDYLYVLGRAAGVVIYDISDPANPVQAGAITGHGESRSDRDVLCIHGRYLYCGYQDHMIRKFDLSNPTAPVLKTTFKNTNDSGVTVSNLRQIVVTDQYVIAGNGGNTARWDNTSDAAEVLPDTARYGLGNISHIEMQGGYIYCMSWDGQIRMYEIAAPSDPATIKEIVNIQNLKDSNNNHIEQAITLDEAGYLYGINGNKLSVYNTVGANTDFYSNNDYITCTYDALADTTDCFVKDGFLYVLSSSKNVTVFDVTEPFAPVLVDQTISATAGGGMINGDYFYLFAPNGLQQGVKTRIYRFTEETRPTGSDIVSELPVKLSGTATGTDSVELVLDSGKPVSVPVADGKWSYTLDTLPVGEHSVSVSVPGTELTESIRLKMPKYLARSFAFNTDRLAANETVSVSCKVENTTEESISPLLIIALYSGDEMKAVNFVKDEIAGNSSQLLKTEITLPENIEGYTVSAFIWESAESISPMSEVLNLRS